MQGDQKVVDAMLQFGAFADQARGALQPVTLCGRACNPMCRHQAREALGRMDWQKLGEAMSGNFALRRRVHGGG